MPSTCGFDAAFCLRNHPTVLTREAVSTKPPPSSRECGLPNWTALSTLQPPHSSTVPSEIVFVLSKGHHYPLQSLV